MHPAKRMTIRRKVKAHEKDHQVRTMHHGVELVLENELVEEEIQGKEASLNLDPGCVGKSASLGYLATDFKCCEPERL